MIEKNNIDNVIVNIKKIVAIARQNVAKEINSKLLQAYWEIGKAIVENKQNGNI